MSTIKPLNANLIRRKIMEKKLQRKHNPLGITPQNLHPHLSLTGGNGCPDCCGCCTPCCLKNVEHCLPNSTLILHASSSCACMNGSFTAYNYGGCTNFINYYASTLWYTNFTPNAGDTTMALICDANHWDEDPQAVPNRFPRIYIPGPPQQWRIQIGCWRGYGQGVGSGCAATAYIKPDQWDCINFNSATVTATIYDNTFAPVACGCNGQTVDMWVTGH